MSVKTIWLIVWGVVLAVGGCAGAPNVIGTDDVSAAQIAAAGKTQIAVFVATSRQSSEQSGVFYSGRRADHVGFGRVHVSIPPNHQAGRIERPSSRVARPETEFVVYDPVRYADDAGFLTGLNTELEQRPKTQRRVLVFVHGYNTNLSQAVLRLAQFVEDTGFKGVPILFSWASEGKATHYVYDLNSALHARDKLEHLAAVLNGSSALSFDLVAHSMGAFLTMETIRQIQRERRFEKMDDLDSVILAAPDIDLDVFKSQVKDIPGWARNIFVLKSRDDQALGVSRTIAGGVPRLGAADIEDLEALGVNVIDLTKIQDQNNLNHSKFTQSPDVVQLLGSRFGLGSDLDRNPGSPVAAVAEAARFGISVTLNAAAR